MKRLKYACYASGVSMAVVANLPPLLFLTFRSLYGISYTQLGLLVLINFVTQLAVDIIFSMFSHRFSVSCSVKIAPVLTVVGMLIYALWPQLLPGMAYIGLVVGTVIFSAAAGLVEVLTSPVIASIPSEDPDREMSKLHSVYAWGVVGLVIVSTVFLRLAGHDNWVWLAIGLLAAPLMAAVLFSKAKIPAMETPERAAGAGGMLKNKGLWLCIVAIFLGGASECTMAQWSSGYLEQALGIPKVWGDVFGVALFGVMLGLGRTLYAKRGKNIGKVLFVGAVSAAVCYLTAVVSPWPILGLVACALTGLCTSMLWPGNLIVVADRFPAGGVFLYAIMAAGGDLGASVGPQLVGIVADTVVSLPAAASLAQNLGLTADQLGMKLGMLAGMLFPLAAIFLYYRLWKGKPNKN